MTLGFRAIKPIIWYRKKESCLNPLYLISKNKIEFPSERTKRTIIDMTRVIILEDNVDDDL